MLLPSRRFQLCLPLGLTRQIGLFVTSLFLVVTALAQVPGPSVNMVTGTQWPGGDPFLERQNEPSMAVSSRNPLHLLAGNNDYRTVDLPGLPTGEPTGDAWLGVFSSVDGGNLWQSVLVPGYPQDSSSAGTSSPLKGFEAAADPTVRAGTNGLFYYSGLVFNRETNGKSAIFVARFVDDNNVQGATAARYVSTSIVATGDATHFLDKPVMAIDVPRAGSPTCVVPSGGSAPSASISAGRIYVAYTRFLGGEGSNQSDIMFSYSNDCGNSWSTPQKVSGLSQTNQGASLAIDPNTGNVYLVWRIFKDKIFLDSLAGEAFEYQTHVFTPIIPGPINPFDQGTTDISFRTNAYPSTAVDSSGRLYIAWSQRGLTTSGPTGGDARIQVLTGTPVYFGNNVILMLFSLPVTVDPYQGRGHQIMPSLAFSSGKLTAAWYDFRNDDRVEVYDAAGHGTYTAMSEVPSGVTPIFSNFVADPRAPYQPSIWRHTVDLRAAQAPPNNPASFSASVLVSQYAFGSPAFDPSASTALPNDPENIQQLDFDAPNLPLFQKGTVPFVGDYIDVAGPTFVSYLNGSTQQWRFNNLATDPDHTHVVWTDNRNVVQPADGNWANFTPVGANGGRSIFDPTQSVPSCVTGQTGIRNQDIYTAALSPGLILSSRGNAKQLSSSLTREFPVTVENPTSQTLYYRLTIAAQPTGGSASFLQAPVNGLPNPLAQLTIAVPPVSSASRSVFVLSSNPEATVSVTALETDVNNNVVPNGLTSTVLLNSDKSNPNISNPNISNVEVYNPNISNPNISNPNVSNPNISNPNISNPNISNPNISNVAFANPNISNPNISNPNISNPNISNPNISNPNISNATISGEITDVSYTVTNAGNTAVSYALNLVQLQPPPQGVTVQLIVSGVYLTPVANGCTLAVQPHYTPIANITNPQFLSSTSNLPVGPPSPQTPTFSLQPGEQALITIRAYDPNATTPAQALLDYNPATAITPVVGSQGVNTGLAVPTVPLPVLSIATVALPTGVPNAPYSYTLQATGGRAPYTFSVLSGSLPPGLTLSPAGVLTGTPAGTGSFTVPVQVTDTSGQTAQRSLTFSLSSGLAIASTALPQGKVQSIYGYTLTAAGGAPPYRWSVAPMGVLPAGMFLDASSGILQGPPGQAGLWNVPITVTDSASPAATQTATLPLTIGLATAYAGSSACIAPYPATPLYYAGATSFTLNASSLPNAAQMLVFNNSNLAGCLFNSPPSGNYPLTFAANVPGGSFTLNLPVVSNDTRDNGSFFIPGYTQASLPPDSNPQGVVPPGSFFQVLGPSEGSKYGSDSGNFTGSYLFGFSGSAASFCTTYNDSTVNLTAGSGLGRFDVLFDGTNQPCAATVPFPATPAPLVLASADVISSTPNIGGAAISNVSLSAPNAQAQSVPNVIDIAQSDSGTTIPATLTFNYVVNQSGCNGTGCIVQLQYGLNSDAGPQACAYNGLPSPTGTSGTAQSLTLAVPNVPGRYYVALDRSLQFGCTTFWSSGTPSATRYIGVVNVLAH